jgi:hypothetical protein
MNFKAHYSVLPSPTDLEIHHLGPDLSEGALPALFYFASSGEESMMKDPYNQPARFFAESGFRTFSFTLPRHGPGYNTKDAITFWAQEIADGKPLIQDFIIKACQNIHYLEDQKIIEPTKLAVAGLSRGGFMAVHLAACYPKLKIILGFAPMVRLAYLPEFQALSPHLDLVTLVDQLIDRELRFYIGNRDMRVGTAESFKFIETLAEAGYQKGYRSPTAELVIRPSIGHQGHGTSPETFLDGIHWLKSRL